MAFRTISLADVKEVLGRWQRGQAQRRIARDTGMDRKTVQRYIEAAGAAGLGPAQGLSDDAVRAVAREVQARRPSQASESWQALSPHREQIERWLSQARPLRLTRVHALLSQRGVSCSYSTLRRFALAELGWPHVDARAGSPPPCTCGGSPVDVLRPAQ